MAGSTGPHTRTNRGFSQLNRTTEALTLGIAPATSSVAAGNGRRPRKFIDRKGRDARVVATGALGDGNVAFGPEDDGDLPAGWSQDELGTITLPVRSRARSKVHVYWQMFTTDPAMPGSFVGPWPSLNAQLRLGKADDQSQFGGWRWLFGVGGHALYEADPDYGIKGTEYSGSGSDRLAFDFELIGNQLTVRGGIPATPAGSTGSWDSVVFLTVTDTNQ